MQSWLLNCRRLIRNSGMVARVCSSVLVAWATSSFVTVPRLKRASTISSVSIWSCTFSWAYLILCSVMRICA